MLGRGGRDTSLRGQMKDLKKMEQVILMLQNLPEQFCLLADSPPTQGHPSISDLMMEASETCCMVSGLLNLSIDLNSLTLSLSLIDTYTRTKVHAAPPRSTLNQPT